MNESQNCGRFNDRFDRLSTASLRLLLNLIWLLSARTRGWLLGVAATNNVAQYRIGERKCQRLAIGEQRGFGQNGLEARQAISLVYPADVSGGLPCHIGKDPIKVRRNT